MNTLANKTKKNAVPNKVSTKTAGNKPSLKIADNRVETVTQQKLQKMANSGVQIQNAVQLHSVANNRLTGTIQKKEPEEEELIQGKFKTIQKQELEEEELLQGKFNPAQKKEIEEEEPLQGKFTTIQKQGLEEEELLQGKFITTQRKGEEEEELMQGKFEPIQKKENNTGLPNNLKSGIENLSGVGMDDVKVHYNSDKPATLQAHAYAQGTDIHVAPGQEKHLPHEAWHVVQQKQGRVKPTMQMKGNVNVNDDKGLEKEADLMGRKAIQLKVNELTEVSKILRPSNINGVHTSQMVIQRLSLNNTNWSNVSNITASTGGVGGVLFMSDANSTLVVKPNVDKDEEMIASHLHGAMSQPPKDKKFDATRWHIESLTRRFANAADIHGIQNQIPAPVIANATNNAKAATLLGQVAANTTMIQEKTGNTAETFEDMLENQKNARNIIPGADRMGKNRKDKLRSDSPLKPLTKEPSFAIALGQLAATDIFLGNFDRLVWAANVGNIMMDIGNKTIFPIDNVDNASTVRFTPHPGNPAITLTDWRNNQYVRWLVGSSWKLLADEVWEGPLVMQNLLDDIISHTDATESASVTTKLTNHIDEIKKNFIKGLKLGRADIRAAGPLPISPSWSTAARNLYNQRLNDL